MYVAALAIALLVVVTLVLGAGIADLTRRMKRSEPRPRMSSDRRDTVPSDLRFDRQS